MELQTKLKFYDKKVKDLERENDGLQSNVQNLEGELEEVQDNFREDEDDEYRIVKRKLEALSKDNRVLSFKLKKSEKSVNELSSEKTELEGRLKQGPNSIEKKKLALVSCVNYLLLIIREYQGEYHYQVKTEDSQIASQNSSQIFYY